MEYLGLWVTRNGVELINKNIETKILYLGLLYLGIFPSVY